MKHPNFFLHLKSLPGACLAVAVFFSAVLSVEAAPVSWTGSTSAAWSDGANWGGTPPVDNITTDTAVFNLASYGGNPPFAPNAGTRSISGIQLGTATGAFTLSGTSLSIGLGGISSLGTNTAAINISSNIVLAANQTWEHASNSRLGMTVSGVVSGTDIELTIAGRPDNVIGQWRLSGNNTYSGTTIIESGNIRFDHVNGLGSSSVSVANGAQLFLAASGTVTNNITLNGGTGYPGNGEYVALRVGGTLSGTLTLADATDSSVGNNSSSGTISGQITGSGALTVGVSQMSGNTGATNAFTLSSTSNNWTGGLTIHGDYLTADLALRAQRFQTLALGASGVITDTNSITFGVSAAETATNSRLNLNGFNETVDLISSFANGYGIIFNGANATTSTLTLGGGSAASAEFSGVIRNDNPSLAGTGVVALTKIGNGTQILSGANTYSGATIVNAGTLLINGDMSGATGAVTVASGATLGGDGTVGGATTVSGIIAPGNSIGELTIDNDLTWNGAAAAGTNTDWKFELGPSDTSDLLSINGDFSKSILSGSVFRFDFLGSTDSGTFTLVQWTGTNGFSVDDFSYTNLGGGLNGSFAFDGNSLQFTAIPEPSSLALVGIGLSALFFRRMSRRKNS